MNAYDPFGDVAILNLPDEPGDSISKWVREHKYRELKEATGRDFGFDVEKWMEWLTKHKEEYYRGLETFMANDLREVEILGLPDDAGDSTFNRFKSSRHQLLKTITGQDFGFDVEKWLEWVMEHKAEYQKALREHYETNLKL